MSGKRSVTSSSTPSFVEIWWWRPPHTSMSLDRLRACVLRRRRLQCLCPYCPLDCFEPVTDAAFADSLAAVPNDMLGGGDGGGDAVPSLTLAAWYEACRAIRHPKVCFFASIVAASSTGMLGFSSSRVRSLSTRLALRAVPDCSSRRLVCASALCDILANSDSSNRYFQSSR